MIRLLLFTSLTLSLYAGQTSLQQYLSATENTALARSAEYAAIASYERDRSTIEPRGFSVEGTLAKADAKESDRSETEYHLSIDKEFTIASTDSAAFLDATQKESQAERGLRLIDIKSSVYRLYVTNCMDADRTKVLEEALKRSKGVDLLIAQGVKNGEFDRAKSLQSELESDALSLRLLLMRQSNEENLEALGSLTGMSGTLPQCEDLSLIMIDATRWQQESLLWQKNQAQITKNDHLHAFADSWLPRLTAGVGYDDEMDVTRALAYVRIPLPYGDHNEALKSTALHQKLSREEEARTLDIQSSMRIRTFNRQQKSRLAAMQTLSETMIPKAEEASELLKKRFLGAEGTFIELAQGREKLFTLQNTLIDIRHKALLSQAKIYSTLGIDPTEESR